MDFGPAAMPGLVSVAARVQLHRDMLHIGTQLGSDQVVSRSNLVTFFFRNLLRCNEHLKPCELDY